MMAGLSIAATIEDRALRRRLATMTKAMRSDASKAIGLLLVRNTQRRIVDERAPDGSAWPALSPAYREVKKGAGMLRASGMLFRSITYRGDAETARVGTNRKYARIQHLGGIIVPRQAKALRFKLASGFMFARRVTIPPRPFLGISRDDIEGIREVVGMLLNR
jgi:phage virion morphogenesis protein